ncbi:MAG: hypothetical protein ABW061_20435 [Polyangiaceae bacterium]
MPDSIYALEFAPLHQPPSTKEPKIAVYTSRLSAVWPDLSALGVPFPKPLNTYRITVSADGPHQTLDDALAPTGPGSRLPNTTWQTTSSDLELSIRAPLGPEEARCNYLKKPSSDGIIVCGPGDPNSIEPSAESYSLDAINNKLRNYPDFAGATGIHCVDECAKARAFMRALMSYSEPHPGFDADEPLGPAAPQLPPPR